MRSCRPVPWLPLLMGAVALAAPSRAVAQAGLSGNALGGQMEEMRSNASSWDKGLQSRSALGQLEEMTGAQVDRSQSSYQSAAPKARSTLSSKQSFNRAMNAAVADAVADVLLAAIFSDNSAAKAKAQAQAEAEAQAAAQAAAAEAARVAEAARQARIKLANDLRSAWDAQDQAMAGNLSGAFDVATGTAFFGQPNAAEGDDVALLLSQVDPPHDDNDPAIVRLPDTPHLGVDPTVLGEPVDRGGYASGLSSGFTFAGTESPEPDAGFQMPELKPRTAIEEAALHAAGWYAQTMTDAVTDALKNLAYGRWLAKLDNLPGMETAKAFLEFQEKYEELSDPLRTQVDKIQNLLATGSQDAARILGSRSATDGGYADRYFAAVEDLGGETAREARGLAFGEVAGRTVDSPEFGPADDGDEPEFSFVRPLNGVSRGRYGHIRISP